MAVLLTHIFVHAILHGEKREQMVVSLGQEFEFPYPDDVCVQKLACLSGIVTCCEEWRLTKITVTALVDSRAISSVSRSLSISDAYRLSLPFRD